MIYASPEFHTMKAILVPVVWLLRLTIATVGIAAMLLMGGVIHVPQTPEQLLQLGILLQLIAQEVDYEVHNA